jgi:hypothetical protein
VTSKAQKKGTQLFFVRKGFKSNEIGGNEDTIQKELRPLFFMRREKNVLTRCRGRCKVYIVITRCTEKPFSG